MTKKDDYLNDLYEDILAIVVNEKLLKKYGGGSYVDLNDLESMGENEYASVLCDMEFSICLSLRKRYLKKHPELAKLARRIAKKIISNEENTQS